jgi:hypothetical protein
MFNLILIIKKQFKAILNKFYLLKVLLVLVNLNKPLKLLNSYQIILRWCMLAQEFHFHKTL